MAKRKNTAVVELKKALKWIVRSGGATVAIGVTITLVQQLQDGNIEIAEFAERLVFVIMMMVLNTIDYYLHQ